METTDINETRSHFQVYFTDMTPRDIIERELPTLCDNKGEGWKSERMAEIKFYNMLQNCQKIVPVLQNIRETYTLKGNFSKLDKISQMVSEHV